MLVCMVAHYPLPCFGLRRTVESLFWADSDAPTVWRIVICLTLIIVTGLLGSFIEDIHIILDYTSSIAGSFVVFILPGLFSIRIWNYQNKSLLRLLSGVITLVTGIFVMTSGLFSSIWTEVHE